MKRFWLAGLFGACAASAGSDSFTRTVQPFVAKNCVACHSSKAMAGGLSLESRTAADFPAKDRDVWERVVEKVRGGEMPPKPLPKPPIAAIDSFTGYIEKEYAKIDRKTPPDPGRVTARRLNRYEYNNAVRDLLGVRFRPADDFPADDSGYGFDNIGDVLSVSPVLMEKYLAAAEQVAKKAIAADPPPKPVLERHKVEGNGRSKAVADREQEIAVEGDYFVRAGISGYTSPFKTTHSIPHTVSIFADGKLAGSNITDTDPDRRRSQEVKVHLTAGKHVLRAAVSRRDCDVQPELRIDFIEHRGPYEPVAPPPPASHKMVMACGHYDGKHEASCPNVIVSKLLRRAFRRPVTAEETAKYVRFMEMAQKEGDSFDQSVRVALEAILVSPEFLFRIEGNSAPRRGPRKLTDLELASRLSFFLWSSIPDEELLTTAEKGELHQPEVMEQQVRRMLRDTKAFALVENFAGQWLALRNIDSVQPDPAKFPEFKTLRSDMRRETEMFIQSVIREDRSILDFLSAKYTFLNARLAKFYGIDGVEGPEFRRVDLETPQRMGILTHASVLTVSSYPTRTSPVIRGKYILENILNTPPPPPPPDVPNLDDSKVGTKMSLRQQLEKHRANAICASCHSKMDPLGFGLENYDAIGRWRVNDGAIPIDSSGKLPNGKTFQTPAEMMQLLVDSKEAFARGLSEKLLTYALGRGLERYDRPAVQSISHRAAEHDYKFSGLVLEVVKSLPFTMRRAELPVRTMNSIGAKRPETRN